MDMTNKRFAYVSLSGGGLSLGASLLSGQALFAAAAAGFFSLGLFAWKYGYLIMPLVVKRSGIVEVMNGEYEIPPAQDVIIKRSGGKYYASAFMSARVTESTTEKSGPEKSLFMEYFERAVSAVKCVSKFSVVVSAVDLSKWEDEIKSKRSFAETKKSRLLVSSPEKTGEISKLEREIVMWNRQLERLGAGERPVDVICYLMTTANGASKEEAVGRVKSQAKEVRSAIGNALNAEVTPLAGEDMKKCFEWERILPASQEEFHDVAY